MGGVIDDLQGWCERLPLDIIGNPFRRVCPILIACQLEKEGLRAQKPINSMTRVVPKRVGVTLGARSRPFSAIRVFKLLLVLTNRNVAGTVGLNMVFEKQIWGTYHI